jgi:hypothetical protein
MACVLGTVALAGCAESNTIVIVDGQCDGTYEILPPEAGDPSTRTRIVIDALCDLGPLGEFTAQTFQVIDQVGSDNATLSGSTIYTDGFGNELFSAFTGSSLDNPVGVSFEGVEFYEGGIGDYGAATGSADLQGTTSLASQTIVYTVLGEVELN